MSKLSAIIAVHLLLIRNDDILLSRRFRTGFEDGKYSLVAGHIEKDETILQAMIREAKEEAAIDVSSSDLEIVQVMYRKSGLEERIDYFIRCYTWTGIIKNNEPDKCDDLRWFPIKNMPLNMVPYVKYAIKMYEKKESFTEFGWNQKI